MKRIRCAVLLCAAVCVLLLSGCDSLLHRSYSSVSAHTQFTNSGTSSDSLRAEAYPDLVSAILHLVSEGTATGVIKLDHYTGVPGTDLENACLEVTQEDPLGAYAVDYIKYDLERVLTSYYEARVEITYRRTPQQIDSIVSVTSSNAIQDELTQALMQQRTEVILKVDYFDESETAATIRQLAQTIYRDLAQTEEGMPEIQVNLYPDSGQQRVVEILMTYPEDAQQSGVSAAAAGPLSAHSAGA